MGVVMGCLSEGNTVARLGQVRVRNVPILQDGTVRGIVWAGRCGMSARWLALVLLVVAGCVDSRALQPSQSTSSANDSLAGTGHAGKDYTIPRGPMFGIP